MTNSNITTLDKIRAGKNCSIVSTSLSSEIKARFAEMGMVSGTGIFVKKKAPLGDPIEIRLRDYTLCIRAAEARQIQVKPL